MANRTRSTQDVRLYAGPAEVEETGFEVGSRGTENDLTRMVTVSPSSVTVAPGETVSASVNITVPADAPQRELYGVVWAELSAEGAQITSVNRVGIRMYVSIGSGDEPASDFSVDTLSAGRLSDGSPVVRANVTNTGGRALDLSGDLRLSEGPGGLEAGPFRTSGVTTLALDSQGEVFVSLDPELPAGPWLAAITVRSGTLERTVEGELTFPDAPDGTELNPEDAVFNEPVDAVPVRPGGPVGPIVSGLFLLLTSGILLAVWRRRQDEEDDETPRTGLVAPEPSPSTDDRAG